MRVLKMTRNLRTKCKEMNLRSLTSLGARWIWTRKTNLRVRESKKMKVKKIKRTMAKSNMKSA